MYMNTIKIMNGDIFQNFAIYKCDKCNNTLPENYPRYNKENIDYCFECGFILGLIDEKLFLGTSSGFDKNLFHAGVDPDTKKITIWGIKQVAPWFRKPKQDRHSQEYKEWRTKVFERDSYSCINCNQHGGNLNAHHIKSFSKFKKLRTVLENGITLCENCHKIIHKK